VRGCLTFFLVQGQETTPSFTLVQGQETTPSFAKTGKMECRTVSGAYFLWLVLQHVLPKGFRRARNFGFLHPNCKRLIALLHLLLKFIPVPPPPRKERPPIPCPCCGAVMTIVKTRIKPLFAAGVFSPIATQGVN
jgi:hypothetical protein